MSTAPAQSADAVLRAKVRDAWAAALGHGDFADADQLGVWDLLDREGDATLARLPAVTGSNERLLGHLLKAAIACGYLRRRADRVMLTDAGRQLVRMRGYFTWAVGGYQEVLGNTSAIVSGAQRFGTDIHRNDAMVARGSGLNDQAFMADILEQVLAGSASAPSRARAAGPPYGLA